MSKAKELVEKYKVEEGQITSATVRQMLSKAWAKSLKNFRVEVSGGLKKLTAVPFPDKKVLQIIQGSITSNDILEEITDDIMFWVDAAEKKK